MSTVYGNGIIGTAANLTTKEITQNGTYTASSDSASGYSSVTVNVASGGGGSAGMKRITTTDFAIGCINYKVATFPGIIMKTFTNINSEV